MYMHRADVSKRDLRRRWAWPDRVFFACGACHVLAYAFIQRYGGQAVWIKPAPGFLGNHVFVDLGEITFDYHGYADRHRFLDHTRRRAERLWPGWSGTLVELPTDVLISEAKSRQYDGLRLREPDQFHRDALPRAEAFVARYPATQWPLRRSGVGR